jgi:MFS family permease
MQVTAQTWVVWTLSHSTAALGVVAMLGSLPILLLGPWTGLWADTLDRRRLLVATQVSAMLLAVALGVLVHTGTIQVWHVDVLATLLGIVTALDMPAQQAFIGDLSGMDQVRQAVVINNMLFQASRMVGPALAGLVVAQLGAAPAFWVNAASFLAVIASLLVVRAHQVRRAGTASLGGFSEALQFIRGHPRAQDLIALTVVVTFFGISVMNILPAVAGGVLLGNADVLGLLMGASGAGALTGALLVVPSVTQIRRTGLVVGSAAIWTGLWLAIFSFSTWVPFSALSMYLGSLAFPVVLTTANGTLQMLAPQDMRARLLSVLLMVSFGAQPFAALLVGYSAQILGTQSAVLANGFLMAVGAIALLALRPALRRWEFSPTLHPAFTTSSQGDRNADSGAGAARHPDARALQTEGAEAIGA